MHVQRTHTRMNCCEHCVWIKNSSTVFFSCLLPTLTFSAHPFSLIVWRCSFFFQLSSTFFMTVQLCTHTICVDASRKRRKKLRKKRTCSFRVSAYRIIYNHLRFLYVRCISHHRSHFIYFSRMRSIAANYYDSVELHQ